MDLKALLSQKRTAKSALTRLINRTSEELEIYDSAKLKVIRGRFSASNEQLKSIFEAIFGLCKDEEIETYLDEREELFGEIDDNLAAIDRAVAKCDKKGETKQSSSRAVESQEVKLPTLSLPIFSGVVEEWLAFSDLFEAAVSKNENLSDAQKLQYLKSSLKGDAQKIVQSLPVTNKNFEIAWNLLSERYFHKRDILASILKKFLNMPVLNSESPSQILNLVDSTKEHVRMLETLEMKVENTADTFLMFAVQFKLDPNTRSWWERTLKNDEVPTLDDLLKFLTNHARSIVTHNPVVKKTVNKKVTLLASGFKKTNCIYCQGDHFLSKCDTFINLPVQTRASFVKSNNACFNCLTPYHHKSNCKSSKKCRKCGKAHHTLLHYDLNREDKPDNGVKRTNGLSVTARVFTPTTTSAGHNNLEDIRDKEKSDNIISCCSDFGSDAQVLLCTALINVCDSFGRVQVCRALLDPGSQACLITTNCLKRLGLPKKRANVLISCLGATDTHTNGVSEIRFSPHFSSSPLLDSAVYVVDKIVGQLPHTSLDPSWSLPFSDLKLADPTFFKSGPVDILLGVTISIPLLKGQTLSSGEGKPFAVRSELGWIIAGNVPVPNESSVIHVNNMQFQNDLVQRFWELDSVPSCNSLTSTEKACEDHFEVTHSRDKDGRYVVKLPFHSSVTLLGESKQTALRRLKSLEYSLSKDPERYKLYRDFMHEYLELKHMEPVPDTDYDKLETYYIPHLAVFRESSSTTKLRVVFDASSKSASGYSLNDLLMVGPRVQQDLYHILLRFRTFRIAVCADVEKMFRQIRVHSDDTDWQRILWRDSPVEPVKEFRLLTVTYGTTSAPFLSTRTLQQLALDEKGSFPLASQATLHHFYVDDILCGAESENEARELVNQLKNMMEKGGFNLHKWNSNCPNVIKDCAGEQQIMPSEQEGAIKVLGIKWNPTTDCFSFCVTLTEEKTSYSKREILSEMSRVFDPLGFLSPCIIALKILIQELWKDDVSWDQPIPDKLNNKWISFRKELHLFQQLKIPRFAISLHCAFELHAFSDASEKAYCAVVYSRSFTSDNEICVSLLTAKTKVAPLKTQSLPRLELCGALLLADLVHAVLKDIPCPPENITAWTDSKIALAWLASEPCRWQPFVGNRVSKIQSTIPSVTWNHVPGIENPADLGTRGLLPSELISNELWLQGPQWLREPFENSCLDNGGNLDDVQEVVMSEQRKSLIVSNVQLNDDHIFFRFSTWTSLVRITAWCLRFSSNAACSSSHREIGFLSAFELSRATAAILKVVQNQCFREEIRTLSQGKPLQSSSRLLSLNPFLDSDGLLRVGGRLRHAPISSDQKHPVLLPKLHHVTSLIIKHFHLTHLHAGPQLLLAAIRTKFWILSGRDAVRKIFRSCVKCFRASPSSSAQLMGDLPSQRVMPSRPFSKVGVDYAGPFLCKERNRRGIRSFKVYIAIFICCSTKAVHLEVVSDLSTPAFLAALKRFVARRGKPCEIMSDCGTNFKGASRELKELYKITNSLASNEQVAAYAASENIVWKFNPPSAPHFGGIWEANIKSAKFHLRRTMGNSLFTIEEFSTLIACVEACLNSRPLCPMSSDPNDLLVLTPGHFLTGAPLTSVAEENVLDVPITRLRRWQLQQRVFQHFWKRWSNEYLAQLQQRQKWQRSLPNLKVGDLVLIKNELVPPLQWKMGRVINTYKGDDDLVRVAVVKTAHGELKRPIHKLCRLPDDNLH